MSPQYFLFQQAFTTSGSHIFTYKNVSEKKKLNLEEKFWEVNGARGVKNEKNLL